MPSASLHASRLPSGDQLGLSIRLFGAARISWRNAPAYRRDWIGTWRAGDTDLYNDYVAFAYTGATVAGATTISGLKPGRYVARLMKDEGYAELARASFTVR